MPELPEVETIRRQLQDLIVGRSIAEAWSHPSPKFTAALEIVGAAFTQVKRRGKYLLLGLDDDRELIVHLGMTGSLSLTESPLILPPGNRPEDGPHVRAWWSLDQTGMTNGQSDRSVLIFRDIRRFGRLRVVNAGDYHLVPTLAAAGPEPFDPDLTPQRFHQLLQPSRRMLKTKLLSQRPIAGVGNIYADEALWMASINPKATRLGVSRAGDLLDAIRSVLAKGIDNGGTTLRDYRTLNGESGDNQRSLTTYGRAGRPCLRCKELLVSAVLDSRTTTWCPHCQRH